MTRTYVPVYLDTGDGSYLAVDGQTLLDVGGYYIENFTDYYKPAGYPSPSNCTNADTYTDSDVISQYANSLKILGLVQNFDKNINIANDLENFYNYVFNLETCLTYGLDVWGRIVDVSRIVNIIVDGDFFGFKQGSGETWNNGVFYSGHPFSVKYLLDDTTYRKLIYYKAMLNLSDLSIPSINKLLTFFFAGRGKCYCVDYGDMQMALIFEFPLEPFEIAIFSNSNCVPRPCGVKSRVIQLLTDEYLGFKDTGWDTWNNGTLWSKIL